MMIKTISWEQTIIIDLRKEYIPEFDSAKIEDWDILDKRYLYLRLALSKTIKEKEEDTWQKER